MLSKAYPIILYITDNRFYFFPYEEPVSVKKRFCLKIILPNLQMGLADNISVPGSKYGNTI